MGDALDTFNGTDPGQDPLLVQLHSLAQQIVAQRQLVNGLLNNVANADASVDFDQLTTEMDYLATLVGEFQQVSAQRTAQNPYALGMADNAILAVGDWANGVIQALPNAVAAVPNAFLQAAGNVVTQAGRSATGALTSTAMGLILPVLVVVGLVMAAESTRTYRKKVA